MIFVIFLYQRWIYPVDKSRVNEFGQEFREGQEKPDATPNGGENQEKEISNEVKEISNESKEKVD